MPTLHCMLKDGSIRSIDAECGGWCSQIVLTPALDGLTVRVSESQSGCPRKNPP